MSATLTPDPAVADMVVSEAHAESLDAVIAEAWSDLHVHRDAECPMCGEAMAPVYGARSLPSGGRCVRCLTELR